MINSRNLIVLLVFLHICQDSDAAANRPLLSITNKQVDEKTSISFPPHGRCSIVVKSVELKGDQAFVGDGYLLTISDASGKVIASHSFQSTYAAFHLDVIDLDANRTPEFVLVTGAGRGTNSRIERLEVFSIYNRRFHERLSTPYSAPYGSLGHWQFKHHYRTRKSGSVEIVMKLTHTRIVKGKYEHPSGIPGDKTRIIRLTVM